ncbi:MAG: hypothetical protein EOO40_00885 [Deltaproteobacteria bacterium]|nr:MAG: hypothetical protein EOO40_00885 [Deltaproteobacteria bacterium]
MATKIESQADLDLALGRVTQIMDGNALAASTSGAELCQLARQIQAYEAATVPQETPTDAERAAFRADQESSLERMRVPFTLSVSEHYVLDIDDTLNDMGNVLGVIQIMLAGNEPLDKTVLTQHINHLRREFEFLARVTRLVLQPCFGEDGDPIPADKR